MGAALGLYREREAGEQFGSSGFSFASCRKVNTDDPELSPRKEIRVMNAVALRRSFPALWASYLRANFASAYAVHKAFPGLDEKTCRDWWNGKRDPSGSFVAAVVARDPNAMKILGGME